MKKIMRNALNEIEAEYAAMSDEQFVEYVNVIEDEALFLTVSELFFENSVESFYVEYVEVEGCRLLRQLVADSIDVHSAVAATYSNYGFADNGYSNECETFQWAA